MKIKLYLISFLLIAYKVPFAQNNQFEFDYIKTENGLPHSTVYDIIQDSLGYIWMATDDGIGCYDNYNIKVYRHHPNDTNGIVNNQVLKLHIDPQNRFWVGTKQSLEVYNEKTESFRHFYFLKSNLEEGVPVIDIFQKDNHTLLLGTDGGGLRYINTENYSSGYFLPDSIRSKVGNRVSSIVKDKYGRYWIATLDRGVFLYNQKLSTLNKPQKHIFNFLENTEIRTLMLLNPKQLLVGTYGKGTISINIESLTASAFLPDNEDLTAANRIFEIVRSDSQLYIGSDGEGLIVVDLKTNMTKSYKNHGADSKSISNNVVRSIYIDQENSLWFGHYQGGISYVSTKNNFRNIKYSPYNRLSLSHSNVTSILVDYRENIWIGTDGGGLNIIRNNVICNKINHRLNCINSGPNPPKILSLYEDKDKNIWIGTYLDGVFIYNSKTKKIKALNELYPDIRLSNNDIRCIMQDRTGKMWIGTNGGGVNIINTETREISVLRRNDSATLHSLSLDWIRFIKEDSYGCIWIGTVYGLNLYDPVEETFQHYFHDEKDSTSVSSDYMFSFTEDLNNEVWIGTACGLNKYDRKTGKFQVFTEADGLPNNIINSIVDTKDGNLWISTNNGISRFNIAENCFCNYNFTDGIASNSFINGACYNQNNEVLYFGSIAGLTYFNPDEITDMDYEIPVILTDFKIFNQSIHAGQLFDKRVILKDNITKTNEVTLLKRDRAITIDFTALSYAYKNKIEYEYRLLGFSDNWTNAKNEHSITYTNLKSGTYNLQIKVGNIGKEQPVRNLKITVLSPIYERWWFKLLVSLALTLVIILIVRLRIISIKRQNELIKKQLEIEKLAAEKERVDLNLVIDETRVQFQKDEMDYKNSQLISTTMLLTHKNEKMNQVKNKIAAFSKSIDNKDLKKDLSEIVKTISTEFEIEKDWNRFEEHFNDVHKDFLKKLKECYPELSLTYLKLCTYLKLDLSTKEIASLMNISQRGVEKSRSRLRKKLELSPEENLNRFISEI